MQISRELFLKNSLIGTMIRAMLFSIFILSGQQIVAAQQIAEAKTIRLPIVAASTNVFYVSRLGNNSSGDSWSTAWSELDQIDWTMVSPGARIIIDGGASEMVYTSMLEVGKSGSPTAPITIELSSESGRNGQVVIDGGRGATLPYCGQVVYADSAETARRHGIAVENVEWIVIDGKKWRGITIRRHLRSGLYLERDTSNITVRNLEIYDNGTAVSSGSGWRPSKPGVRLGGYNQTLDRLIVYDNGEDAIQSLWDNNNLANITITRSWLHNMRRHPIVNESSNYCTHADGFQIYDGGLVSGITIEESIIGPGLTNGIILGQTLIGEDTWAAVQDVVLRNTIFTKVTDNAIYAYQNTESHNWVLDHVTLDCTNTKYNCINIDTPQHEVHNTIVYGAKIYFENGLDTFSNNCQWKAESFQLGEEVDPLFSSMDEINPVALNDYAMPADSPCTDKGASITSVQHLLDESAQSATNP